MKLCLMLEGQHGLNWERWQRITRLAQELGFAGVFRSDHFTNAGGPLMDSLELWTSLTWLASHSQRIEFGPLVTPASFRHPVFTARMAKDVDRLSDGRFTLGIGAGWQAREHEMFGFPLLEIGPRFDRFEESVEVIHGLLRNPEPVDFEGEYYQLEQAQLLPPPLQFRPRLLIGGNGRRRTLKLAAGYADEWNPVFIGPDSFSSLNRQLDEYLDELGRPRQAVTRSLMTNLTCAPDQAGLQAKAGARGTTVDQMRQTPSIVGTIDQAIDQIGAYREAGVHKIMLQWLELDDLDGLTAFAEAALPVFHGV